MSDKKSTGRLMDLSVEQMLGALSSSEPAPGGGAASALTGAMAAALIEMVAGLTLDRPRYANVQPQMRITLARVTPLRAELAALVDEDASAYGAVIAAMRLPKDTETQQKERSEAIERATLQATLTPLRVAGAGLDLLGLALDVIRHGNPNALSDGAVAALLAQAAVAGAIRNVRINLATLAPSSQVDELNERANSDEVSATQLLQTALRFASEREKA